MNATASSSSADSAAPHPLDEALRLAPRASDGGDAGTLWGETHKGYWNMVGPFGGVTAATVVQAVMQHAQRLGDPVALTINYAGALVEGPLRVVAVPARTNRSTQHWTVTVWQDDASGEAQVATTATLVTAVRRSTWSADDTPMPDAPAPEQVRAIPMGVGGVAWLDRYEMRFLDGMIPMQWEGQEKDSTTRLWMRDQPPRALDFAALAGLCDVFYPRVWLRRARQVPTGTVSMTVYFHADAAQLAAVGTGYVQGMARAQAFRHGFFDQTAQLWAQDGGLLATSHQTVYYKE